jgi:hypothetical protein
MRILKKIEATEDIKSIFLATDPDEIAAASHGARFTENTEIFLDTD